MVGHIFRHAGLVNLLSEGTMVGRNRRGGQRLEYVKQTIEDVGCNGYVKMKRLTQDRRRWRIALNQSRD